MATLSSRLTPLTVSVPAMSEWTSYTPTGPWSTNSTYTGRWRRVGDSIQLMIDIAFSGAPNAANAGFTAAQLLNGLGLSIDLTKLPNTTDVAIANGSWVILDSGANVFNGSTNFGGTGDTQCYRSAGGIVSDTAPVALGNGDNFSLTVTIPISGWTSHTASATSANAVVVGGQSVGSTMNFGATSNQGFNILANNVAAIASTAAGALTLGNTSVPANFAGTNIVGRIGTAATSAIAAGYVGEVRSFTSRTTTGSTGVWVVNTSALDTLTSGVWLICGRASVSSNNAASVIAAAISTNNTADGSGLVVDAGIAFNQVSTAANTTGFALPPVAIGYASSQAIYAKSFSEDASVNVTVFGIAIRIA